jgi:DNA-binding SARP family transcriptional activator
MARLSLQVLGPLRASLGGAPLGLESNKVRALLVYLAMESARPHSREVVAEMFWPGQPQRLAMNDLRYALADLRSHLEERAAGPRFLAITHDTVQFNLSADAWLDAAELRAVAEAHDPPGPASLPELERVAALCRGSFLEGFSVRNSAPFEEWALAQREQLARCAQQVLAALADHYESLGRFPQALRYARQRLDTDPLDEDAHQQVMRLLVFDGQRSAALGQYQTCARLLRQELDIAPSAQSTSLYESIRDGALYIPMHFAVPAGAPASGPEPPFVAREQELSALAAGLDRALAGQGHVAFVTGEAGSGKTMLVREFQRRSSQAHPGLVTLYGNCNSFAGTIDPYLPFIELFRMLAADTDAQQASGSGDRERSRQVWDALPVVIRALLECGPDLLDRFIPAEELLARARTLEHFQVEGLERLVRARAGNGRPPAPGAGAQGQSQLFEQAGSVLRAVSHAHPLLIAVDDLQWADQDTVNLLFYLCRRLGGSRIMLIGTYRFPDGAAPLRAGAAPFFPALRELQAVSQHAPLDLSRADAHHFVNALLDSDPNVLGAEFRAALEQHTAGIPLFVV